MSNEFVHWDDHLLLVNNPHYRGLGWTQLHWMFTTAHGDHYRPLTWATFGLDYTIWGVNPTGYHLTNLVLHTVNAVLFYFVSIRLLRLALPSCKDNAGWQLIVSAAFAALLFSIHPLRVQSVAWAADRKDLLAGCFFLCAVTCYLRANSGASRRWIIAALAACVLSLLSKSIGMTLPIVLLILDIYPLRRLEWNPRQWFFPESRRVLWEKVPFALIAIPFALIALILRNENVVHERVQNTVGYRLVQAFYGASFYLWKTVAPVGLSPFYEQPAVISLSIIAGAIATIVLTIYFCLLRRRWPAGWACWLYSTTTLAPVLGLYRLNMELVADRNSYLSCFGWAVLGGGFLLRSLQVRRMTRGEKRRQSQVNGARTRGALVVAILILIVLASFSWRGARHWQNTETLWRRVLEVDPISIIANIQLGRFLSVHGNYRQALSHCLDEVLPKRLGDTDLFHAIHRVAERQQEFEKSLALLSWYTSNSGIPIEIFQNYRQALRSVIAFNPASVC